MQEPLQTKWEVHSDPVKAIKAEDAGLSLHKLPEPESTGKYTEAHNINSACVLCMCVCVYWGVLLGQDNCNCSSTPVQGDFGELTYLTWTHSVKRQRIIEDVRVCVFVCPTLLQ